MDRRSFLRGLIAAPVAAKVAPALRAVAAVSPAPVARGLERAACIADDFTINYVQKEIRYTGGKTTYTVEELYTWLMSTFDEEERRERALLTPWWVRWRGKILDVWGQCGHP